MHICPYSAERASWILGVVLSFSAKRQQRQFYCYLCVARRRDDELALKYILNINIYVRSIVVFVVFIFFHAEDVHSEFPGSSPCLIHTEFCVWTRPSGWKCVCVWGGGVGLIRDLHSKRLVRIHSRPTWQSQRGGRRVENKTLRDRFDKTHFELVWPRVLQREREREREVWFDSVVIKVVMWGELEVTPGFSECC